MTYQDGMIGIDVFVHRTVGMEMCPCPQCGRPAEKWSPQRARAQAAFGEVPDDAHRFDGRLYRHE